MLQEDRLRDVYSKKFGSDWRKEISLTLRADTLFWFVHLIEFAIEKKRDEFKKSGIDASAAASLGSWQADLENLVNRISSVINPKKVN